MDQKNSLWPSLICRQQNNSGMNHSIHYAMIAFKLQRPIEKIRRRPFLLLLYARMDFSMKPTDGGSSFNTIHSHPHFRSYVLFPSSD